ncbi:KAP family NTPase [Escherichia fergusonii]|uniref:KAP family P-loop NTPase fold protein n=1 Tax=Escherichia fergusonii TaxID=564 RepID=UPI001CBFE3F2|nr:P-loop NTPase fold protein [Escherichia fergusonii]UAT36182.1 KAP family NTPase [Escherichia fergusonii]
MRLTVPEIDCNDGFTVENDIFKRKSLSNQIENIISNCDDESLVIALNDKWGNGKTTFLKMWEAQINNDDKFKVVYFDAFKNDFQNDPFIAVASHIYSLIEDSASKKNYLNATKKVASVLLKTSLKVGVNALTLGMVKDSAIEDFSTDISTAINDPLEKWIEEKVTQLDEENKTIEHFRTTLSEIAGDKKLIFIIDELDRARPNYSLELLEKIKHVFSTKNIFFVLSIDKEQFTNIIQKTYGNIDADVYLNKFIHLWFSLPNEISEEGNSKSLYQYMKYINKKILDRDLIMNTSIEILTYLLHENNLSLRDVERCYSLLLICNSSAQTGYDNFLQTGIAITCFLKLRNEKILGQILNKTITKKKLLEELNIKLTSDNDYEIYNMIIKAINTEYMTYQEYNKAIRENDANIFKGLFSQPKTISFAIGLLNNVEM